jgi:hypothetical protein
MIDHESEPGAWARELERLGSHGPRVIGCDERATLLETIRRLEDRLVILESGSSRMRLTLEALASSSCCEVCRGMAAGTLATVRR